MADHIYDFEAVDADHLDTFERIDAEFKSNLMKDLEAAYKLQVCNCLGSESEDKDTVRVGISYSR